MIKYKFFYDYFNDKYRCTYTENSSFRSLSLKSAKERVKKLKFNHLYFTEKSLTIANDMVEVEFRDIDKSKVVEEILVNNLTLLEEHIDALLESKLANSLPINMLLDKKTIVVGTIAALMLSLTISQIDLATNIDENLQEPSYVTIQMKDIEAGQDITAMDEKIEESNAIAPLLDEVEVEEDLQEETSMPTIYIEHGYSLDDDRYINVTENYMDAIKIAAEDWGLDANLLLAILTQESGGKVSNKMQICFSANEGGTFKVFNVKKGQYVTFKFSNDPSEVSHDNYVVVRKADLDDPSYNIYIGAMMLKANIQIMDNHLFAGILSYNQGIGNMNKIFRETMKYTGVSKEDILSDQTNISFYEYAYASHQGDKYYLDNIFQFFDGDVITYQKNNEDGEIETLEFSLESPEKSKNLVK